MESSTRGMSPVTSSGTHLELRAAMRDHAEAFRAEQLQENAFRLYWHFAPRFQTASSAGAPKENRISLDSRRWRPRGSDALIFLGDGRHQLGDFEIIAAQELV